MIEGRLTKTDMEKLHALARNVAGVDVTFDRMKPELDNYLLIIMDSIIY